MVNTAMRTVAMVFHGIGAPCGEIALARAGLQG